MDDIERLRFFNASKAYHRDCIYLYNNMVSVGGPILDIGCGIGGMFEFMKYKGIDVHGIEPREDFLKALDFENTLQGSAEKIPFKDNHFYSAYFMHSFGHVDDYAKAAREVKRVLIPEGKLYILTPNKKFKDISDHIVDDDSDAKRHLSKGNLVNILIGDFKNIKVKSFGALGFQNLFAIASNSNL